MLLDCSTRVHNVILLNKWQACLMMCRRRKQSRGTMVVIIIVLLRFFSSSSSFSHPPAPLSRLAFVPIRRYSFSLILLYMPADVAVDTCTKILLSSSSPCVFLYGDVAIIQYAPATATTTTAAAFSLCS